MVCSHLRYSLFEAREKEEAVGEDIGYDAHGEPTTDPGAILDGGAIRTFDRCATGLLHYRGECCACPCCCRVELEPVQP